MSKFSPHRKLKLKYGFDIHKDVAIDLLKQTITVLDRLNINYFLISGVLLGYVRHKDLIPWDDDMDLLVDSSIYEKLLLIGDSLNFISKGIDYKLLKVSFKDKVIPIRSKRWESDKYHWPFIDLFPYTINENKILFFDKEWDLDKFFPIKKADFLGINCNIPNTPEYFLERNYGDYMTAKDYKNNHKNG